MSILFPQYRKYANDKAFFKIDSLSLFTELKIMGNFYHIFTVGATQLPDRNFIADLLAAETPGVVVITHTEYNSVMKVCDAEKTLLSQF